GHGEAIVPGFAPNGASPRIGLAVRPEHPGRLPFAVVEFALFPSRGCILGGFPRLIAGLHDARLPIGDIANSHEQPGRAGHISRFHGNYVVAVNELRSNFEMRNLPGIASLAHLGAVDPDGKRVVGCDVEGPFVYWSLDVAVDLERLA